MNTTDHEELMQRVLDGAATPEEESQLRAALAGSDALRNRFDELQRLFDMLESVCDMEPPPEAMQQVIQDFRARLPSQAGGRGKKRESGWIAAGLEALRQRLSPQLAYAFVTGAVAGVALLAVFDGQSRPGVDAGSPGTLRPLQAHEAGRVVDAVSLEAPGFRGEARTRDVSGSLVLEIDCESTAAATLYIVWVGASPKVLGFEQAQAQAHVTLDDGGMRIDHTADNRYRLWFAPAGPGSALRLQVVVGDVTLERELEVFSGSF